MMGERNAGGLIYLVRISRIYCAHVLSIKEAHDEQENKMVHNTHP